LPESLPDIPQRVATKGTTSNTNLRVFVPSLGPLLGLALVGQFALAIFEATFALYGQAKFHYGPTEVGSVFVVCGLVMAIVQVGAVSMLAARISETDQIGWGFGLMGMSLVLLVIARSTYSVLPLVGLFALGTALIAPNLAALISTHGGRERAGSVLGTQSAVNSVGQASGPLLGGALFVWHMNAPYLLTAALLISIAFVIEWNALVSRAAIGSATSRFVRTSDNWLHGRSHP